MVVGAGLNITGQVAPEVDRKTAGDTRKIDIQEVNRLQEHGDNNLAETMTKWGR